MTHVRTVTTLPAGSPRLRVLCVDDEPRVLHGLSLSLRRHYEVLTATSCAEGLEVLHREGDVAVVISDMHMPGADGASFLRLARHIAPDAACILLTGHADRLLDAEAVNRGQICAYLLKPCAPQALVDAVDEAVNLYRMNVARRARVADLRSAEEA